MAPESRMTTACRTFNDKDTSSFSSRGVRRCGRSSSRSTVATAIAFALGMLLQVGSAYDSEYSYEYGDPIEVVLVPSGQFTIEFEGSTADAVAVSFQQCSGNEYMGVDVKYDGNTMLSTTGSAHCNRIVSSGVSVSDSALDYDVLCAFENSGTLSSHYRKRTALLEDTIYRAEVNPAVLSVEFTNPGTTTAAAQVVLFSTNHYPPSADVGIDRVYVNPVQDDNIYNIEAQFRAEGTADQNFCSSDQGCAVYAYYLEIDEKDPQADLMFETTCHARTGMLMFEGFTGGGENSDDDVETVVDEGTTTTDGQEPETVASTTTFDMSACVEFPKNTAGSYRVFLVVSPDTESYARVGYGLQDQLIFASDPISVEDDMDKACPEIVVETSDTGGSLRLVATPVKVLGPMGVSLMAAATRAGF